MSDKRDPFSTQSVLKILTALSRNNNANPRPLSFSELVINAWQASPSLFGLEEHEEYPDSSIIYKLIQEVLLPNGLVTESFDNKYSLTGKGKWLVDDFEHDNPSAKQVILQKPGGSSSSHRAIGSKFHTESPLYISIRERIKNINVPTRFMIEDLPLGRRVMNALVRGGINTLDDLISEIQNETLHEIKGIGQIAIDEIDSALAHLKWQQFEKGGIDNLEEQFEKLHQEVNFQIRNGLLHPEISGLRSNFKYILNINPRASTISQLRIGINGLERVLQFSNIYEECIEIIDKLEDRDLILLLGRYSPHQVTLQVLGDELNLSRQRIQQLQTNLPQKINKLRGEIPLVRIQTSLLIARDLEKDISYQKWEDELQKRKLLGNRRVSLQSKTKMPVRTVDVSFAISLALSKERRIRYLSIPDNLKAASKSPDFSLSTINKAQSVPPDVVRKIRRTAKNCGAIFSSDLADELSISKKTINEMLSIFGYEQIETDWFFLPLEENNSKYSHQNALFNSTLKILKCVSETVVEELWEGAQQQASRLNFTIAPLNVFVTVLHLYRFKIENGNVTWPKENPARLSKRDRIFIDLVEQEGPIVTFREIIDAFINGGMSDASAIQLLQFSPITKRMGFGLYKLRGKETSPLDYQDAIERRSRIDRDTEITYTTSGEVIWKVNIGSMGMRGSISSYNLPELLGNWQSYANGKSMGEVKANENFIWNMKPIITELGLALGDRIELKFNMWSRKLFVEKL